MKTVFVALTYGNTHTFLIRGQSANLLVDTDYAGTLPAFYRALKANGIRINDIGYVMATHFHPDHCGLIGLLQSQGIRLLLVDSQVSAVHYPDYIFARDQLDYRPVDSESAVVISTEKSRTFLKALGIDGEIICTPSHSKDSISLILDDGNCFVGDLEPREYLDAYDENSRLRADWDLIMSLNPNTIHYAHSPERPAVNGQTERKGR